MHKKFDELRQELYARITELVDCGSMFKAKRSGVGFYVDVPEDFSRDFNGLVDRVNLSLIEDEENFYGYFLFQMLREIRFDIASPTGVNFKNAKYVISFNPVIFLQLSMEQMQSTIKHEIYHIISLHMLRAEDLKKKYSTLAVNIAMDVVVNQYLNYLPPYATTLEWINLKYDLQLEPYNTMEYYAEKLQDELDLQEEDDKGDEDDTKENDEEDKVEKEFDPEKSHDIWEESDDIDEKTLKEFTEKFVSVAEKGKLPLHLENMIKKLRSDGAELPWNLFLKKLMGTVESNKKKTVTRRNRRQPERLDLRGQIRSHKAKIVVAIDISGSITDGEFKQAIREVLSIVKNYNHEITIVECDKEIRRAYKANSVKDVRERAAAGGGTRFTPVFEYVNKEKANLLIYFTDGKGEDKLEVIPRGYKTLWVISGKGEGISLKHPFGTVKRLAKPVEENPEDEIVFNGHESRTDGWSANSQEPMI